MPEANAMAYLMGKYSCNEINVSRARTGAKGIGIDLYL